MRTRVAALVMAMILIVSCQPYEATAGTITDRCLEVAKGLPPASRVQGMIVLAEQHPSVLDITTGNKLALTDGKWQLSTSPNGEWLASQFVDNQNEVWLAVENAEGSHQTPIPWNDDWFLLGGWLDNEHIWISHHTEPLVTVVNPFSGEQQMLVPDFPGIETIADAGEHYVLGASSVLYNPSLNLAVYPRLESDGYVHIVLWDRQAGRVLAKVKDTSKSFSYRAIWSLDQKEVYVTVADQWDSSKPEQLIYDFYSLAQDGQVKQLTNFGNSFTYNSIGSASLSPNGRKIAFWLDLDRSAQENQQLATLDLDNLQVTNYCVPGSYVNDAPASIWSLDSRYLAVYNSYEPNVERVILVDIKEGWAAEVAEIVPHGWPAGWLKK
jgi:hypothetical protein